MLICWSPFILPLTLYSGPTPLELMHPLAMSLPPLCFIVGMMHDSLYLSPSCHQILGLFLIPNSSNKLSSDQTTWLQACVDLCLCNLAKFCHLFLFNGLIHGFLTANRLLNPIFFSSLLIVFFDTEIPRWFFIAITSWLRVALRWNLTRNFSHLLFLSFNLNCLWPFGKLEIVPCTLTFCKTLVPLALEHLTLVAILRWDQPAAAKLTICNVCTSDKTGIWSETKCQCI